MKFELKSDIITYKCDAYGGTLKGNLASLLSTSVAKKGALGGEPNITIIIPKGTKGAYIEALSEFKKQREFLLANKQIIKDVYKDEGLIIKVIENGKK